MDRRLVCASDDRLLDGALRPDGDRLLAIRVAGCGGTLLALLWLGVALLVLLGSLVALGTLLGLSALGGRRLFLGLLVGLVALFGLGAGLGGLLGIALLARLLGHRLRGLRRARRGEVRVFRLEHAAARHLRHSVHMMRCVARRLHVDLVVLELLLLLLLGLDEQRELLADRDHFRVVGAVRVLEHRARLLERERGRLHLALLFIRGAELLQVARERGRIGATRVLLDRVRLLVERDRLLIHALGGVQVGERRDGRHHERRAPETNRLHKLDRAHEHERGVLVLAVVDVHAPLLDERVAHSRRAIVELVGLRADADEVGLGLRDLLLEILKLAAHLGLVLGDTLLECVHGLLQLLAAPDALLLLLEVLDGVLDLLLLLDTLALGGLVARLGVVDLGLRRSELGLDLREDPALLLGGRLELRERLRLGLHLVTHLRLHLGPRLLEGGHHAL